MSIEGHRSGSWVARIGAGAVPPTLAAPDAAGRSLRVRTLEPGTGWPAADLARPAGDLSLADDKECWALFDGVLFTGAALRAQLADAGPPDTSDAELILKAYLRVGEAVLPTLRGTFALVVWDGRTRTALCCRDPIGLWPLFYAVAPSGTLLSPSIDALLDQPDVSRSVDRVALGNHFRHMWPHPEETYFSAIKRVPSGHVLRLSAAGHRSSRFWDPDPEIGGVEWIPEDGLDRFEGLFDQAVDRCLDLGQPGIFLSGGLDSVSVAAVAVDRARKRGLPAPRALSIVFPVPECDEESVQRGVADRLGLPLTIMPFYDAVGPSGCLQTALDLSAKLPAPLLNTWQPAYEALASEASQRGTAAILTGTGGDEWLTVSPYYAADLILRLDAPGVYRLWRTHVRSFNMSALRILRNTLWIFGVKPILADVMRTASLRTFPAPYLARWRNHLDAATPRWLAPDPALRADMDRSAQRLMPGPGIGKHYFIESRTALDHPLTSMEYEEAFEYGTRLGARPVHPYLDADLIDFLYRVHPRALNRGGRSKGMVRGMVSRRFPQLGFESQVKLVATGFYRQMLTSEARAALLGIGGITRLAELGLVRPGSLESELESLMAGKDPNRAYRLWDILNLEVWARARA